MINLKVGFIRTWVVLSVFWLGYGVFTIVQEHNNSKSSREAANTLRRIVDDAVKREEEIEYDKLRAFHDILTKSGIKKVFDERDAHFQAANKAYATSIETDEYKWMNEAYGNSNASKERRDFYTKIVVMPPIALGILLFSVYWIIAGFRPTAKQTDTPEQDAV